MTTSIDPAVWAGVNNAIASYAHALDSGLPDAVAATFAPDGISEIQGFGTFEGHEAIRDGYATLAPTAPQLHLVANTVVTSTGSTTAAAVSSLAYFSRDEAGWTLRMTGRYDDTLRLVDGAWLFSRRVTTITG